MTTLRNTFHGTDYNTRKSIDDVDRIVNTMPIYRTEAEQRWVRRVRQALCGVKNCQCGDDLGRRGSYVWDN